MSADTTVIAEGEYGFDYSFGPPRNICYRVDLDLPSDTAAAVGNIDPASRDFREPDGSLVVFERESELTLNFAPDDEAVLNGVIGCAINILRVLAGLRNVTTDHHPLEDFQRLRPEIYGFLAASDQDIISSYVGSLTSYGRRMIIALGEGVHEPPETEMDEEERFSAYYCFTSGVYAILDEHTYVGQDAEMNAAVERHEQAVLNIRAGNGGPLSGQSTHHRVIAARPPQPRYMAITIDTSDEDLVPFGILTSIIFSAYTSSPQLISLLDASRLPSWDSLGLNSAADLRG